MSINVRRKLKKLTLLVSEQTLLQNCERISGRENEV